MRTVLVVGFWVTLCGGAFAQQPPPSSPQEQFAGFLAQTASKAFAEIAARDGEIQKTTATLKQVSDERTKLKTELDAANESVAKLRADNEALGEQLGKLNPR